MKKVNLTVSRETFVSIPVTEEEFNTLLSAVKLEKYKMEDENRPEAVRLLENAEKAVYRALEDRHLYI